jgi:hypothetical protein
MADECDDVALLRSYRSAALSALASGDYASAIGNALAAQLVLSSMPQHLTRSQGSGGGNQALAWPGEEIDRFIVRCRQQQGAAVGIQTANIVRQPPRVTGNSPFQPGGGF